MLSRLICFLSIALVGLIISSPASAQMQRQLADPGGPIDEIFWATEVIGLSSVTNIPKRNLNFSIRHVFGVATNGTQDLFGLDAAANIRFGLDYGVTDRVSVGFGRSRFDKLYDFRFKANLLRQTKDNSMPIELAVKGDMGISTLSDGLDFIDKLSYLSSLLIARKFSDQLSIQVSPMWVHFNTVFRERGAGDQILEQKNDLYGLGLVAKYELNERLALLAEFVPVLGARSDGTKDAISLGMDLETGGHVFQLFITTSQSMTEQNILGRNVDDFFEGDFRIGFNIHRVFAL